MKYELIHDTIAKQIFEKASTEARTRRKVERYVRERYQAYLERGAKLTQDDVDFVTPYLEVVNISVEEAAFVENSRQELFRAKRQRQIIILGAVLVLSAFSVMSFVLWRNAERQTLLAQEKTREAVLSDSIAQVRAAEALAKSDTLSLREIALQDALVQAQLARDTSEQRRLLAELAQIEADKQRTLAEQRAAEAEALALITIAKALPFTKRLTAFNIATHAYTRAQRVPLGVVQGLYEVYTNLGEHGLFPPIPTIKYSENSDEVSAVRLSTDEELLLTFLIGDSRLKCWTIDGKFLGEIPDRGSFYQSKVNIHPSNKQILIHYRDGSAKLWSINGMLLRDFSEDETYYHQVAFWPESEKIALLSKDGELQVFENNEIQTVEWIQSVESVQSFAFSPNGDRIITKSSKSGWRLWTSEGTLLSDFEAGTHYRSMVFSPNGEWIASTGPDDRSQYLWDSKGQLIQDYKGSQRVNFSPNGQYFVRGNTLYQADGTLIRKLESAGNVVLFGADGNEFYTNGHNSQMKAWNAEGALIRTYPANSNWYDAFYPLGDSTLQLFRLQFGFFHLYDKKGTKLLDMSYYLGSYNITVSRKYNCLITVRDGQAIRYSLNDPLCITLGGHTGPINDVVISPEGKMIATASDDGSVRLWKRDGTLIDSFNFHRGKPVHAVSFSLNGQELLTAGEDEKIRLSKLDGTAIQDWPWPQREYVGGRPGREKFYPKKPTVIMDEVGKYGQVISFTDKDTTTLLTLAGTIIDEYPKKDEFQVKQEFEGFDLKKTWVADPQGKELFEITARKKSEFFNVPQLIPDEDEFLISSSANRVQLWTREGELVINYPDHTDAVTAAKVARDGTFFVTASRDYTARIWPTPKGIYQFLQKAPLPNLTPEERQLYGIDIRKN